MMMDFTGIVSQLKVIPGGAEVVTQQTEEQYNMMARRKIFTDLCPPLYRETDIRRLPAVNYRQIMAWRYDAKGLLLTGASGLGKTRCAWKLIERIICEDKPLMTFKWYDAIQWGSTVSRKFFDVEITEEWLDYLGKVDILFLDDLFKSKMSEAQESAVYDVVERRSANKKPLLITMNATAATIKARMTEAGRSERYEAIMRRLVEFTTVINFK